MPLLERPFSYCRPNIFLMLPGPGNLITSHYHNNLTYFWCHIQPKRSRVIKENVLFARFMWKRWLLTNLKLLIKIGKQPKRYENNLQLFVLYFKLSTEMDYFVIQNKNLTTCMFMQCRPSYSPHPSKITTWFYFA